MAAVLPELKKKQQIVQFEFYFVKSWIKPKTPECFPCVCNCVFLSSPLLFLCEAHSNSLHCKNYVQFCLIIVMNLNASLTRHTYHPRAAALKSRCSCSVDDLPKDMSQNKCVYKCNVQDAGPQTSPWLHYHQRSMGYIQSYQSFIYIFFILFWSCAPQSSLGEISCMEFKSDFWPFTSPCLTGCCGQVFTLRTRSLYLLFIWKRSRMIYKKKNICLQGTISVSILFYHMIPGTFSWQAFLCVFTGKLIPAVWHSSWFFFLIFFFQ